MNNNKLSIWTLLIVILTSCPVLADKGGVGNGSGSWQGQVESIPDNPGRDWQQLPGNTKRQELQPLPEQMKRDYNQLQREQKQQFQQNWKKIKKIN